MISKKAWPTISAASVNNMSLSRLTLSGRLIGTLPRFLRVYTKSASESSASVNAAAFSAEIAVFLAAFTEKRTDSALGLQTRTLHKKEGP